MLPNVFVPHIHGCSLCSYRYRLATAAGVAFEMVDILATPPTGELALSTKVQFPGSKSQDDVEHFVASLQKNASAVLYESTYFQRFHTIEVTNISIVYFDIPIMATPAISPAATSAPNPPFVVSPIMSPNNNGMVRVCLSCMIKKNPLQRLLSAVIFCKFAIYMGIHVYI